MLIEKNIYTLFVVGWGFVKHEEGKSKSYNDLQVPGCVRAGSPNNKSPIP